MAKVTIPPADPAQPRGTWDNIIFSTPVILAVVATVLAGLSSSEMSQAQYYRSMAAQMQSKVGDQWAFFQAKRLRSNEDQNILGLLASDEESGGLPDVSINSPQRQAEKLIGAMEGLQAKLPSPLSDQLLKEAWAIAASLNQASTRRDMKESFETVQSGRAPKLQDQPIDDPALHDVMDAIAAQVDEADALDKVAKLKQEQIDQAEEIARKNSAAFDDAVSQISFKALEMQAMLNHLADVGGRYASANAIDAGGLGRSELDDLLAQIKSIRSMGNQAHLRFDLSRLEQEARYNQTLAQVMEVQVRMDDSLSDRCRRRSKQFFFGMLGAQAGVTIGTMSLAVKKHRWLWFAAAAAGLFAIVYAGYVYLYV